MTVRVKPLSIVDAVAADMRNNIFAGVLLSGTQITESDIAGTYSVARPTAKAAIEKLVSEGLLLRGPHKTARVPVLGPGDVRDLYFNRTLIESQVVRYLAEQRLVPDEAVRVNKEVLARGEDSALGVIEPVIRFHTTLVAGLNSPRLSRLYATLIGEMRLCMVQMGSELLRPKAIAAEHRQILDRIAAGDPEGAVLALNDHLRLAEGRRLPSLKVEATDSARTPVTGLDC